MKKIFRLQLAFALLASLAPAVFAHVSLEEPKAATGSAYKAVFRIGHGCDGAATTSVSVQLPPEFEAGQALAKPGWSAGIQGGVAKWAAIDKQAALPDGQRGEFVVAGTLPRAPGPLWFKVLQTCERGSLDWSQVPATGTSTAGLKTPAALLEVMSPAELAQAQRAPKVEAGWVRSTVTGQQGSGAFMKLTAREPMQLVGVSTPVAGTSAVHEMKLDGDVMRMRPVAKLDLPAGQAVELKPSGYHVMLLDLKQPLVPGSTVPLTLMLRDAKGAESRLELKLPVAAQAPGAAPGTLPAADHKH